MKTSIITVLMIGAVLSGNSLLANEGHNEGMKGMKGMKHDSKTAIVKQQTNCPVMTQNKINKKLYVDADGKRIYVCCKGCISKVKANPKKYIKQLKDAGQQVKSLELKLQTNCPVMTRNKINKKLYVDADGKRIYVCCKGCLPMVKRNPAKYIKKLKAQGIAVAATPKP
ncbi:MAG: hypothetical protein L3J71_02910 [Victivallaceae bacterium]|nr:hypothetical protein [Victivallaceae bacterium]